jgi:hypothetical protein
LVTVFASRVTLQCGTLEFKRLISLFTYRIEPKPEGGFIAYPSEPSAPAIEAATRQELQQKIQACIAAVLGSEFPGLKLPREDGKVQFGFHVEHSADGGFIIQSTDGKDLPIIGSNHSEIENKFAEKVAGALGKELMPEFAKALAAAGSGDVKVTVSRKASFSFASHKPSSASGETRDGNPQSTSLVSAGNSPVMPEANKAWPIIRLLLLAFIVAATFYFLHR